MIAVKLVMAPIVLLGLKLINQECLKYEWINPNYDFITKLAKALIAQDVSEAYDIIEKCKRSIIAPERDYLASLANQNDLFMIEKLLLTVYHRAPEFAPNSNKRVRRLS